MDSLALPWLPEPAPDFADRAKALRAAFDPAAFKRLATARLNLQQLVALARALPRDPAKLPAGAWRLRVLSNATADLLLPAFAATAPRHDSWLSVSAAPLGTHVQECLDPASDTRRQLPEVVLLALDHHAFELRPCPGQAEVATRQVDAAVGQVLELAAGLQSAGVRCVIVQTLPVPQGALLGSLDGVVTGTPHALVAGFNRQLRAQLPAGVLLLDLAALAATIGIDRWVDASLWNLGKFPCSQAAVPLYAEHLARLLMAVRGRAKKCLVLDLDNTVWGGVIGDDGLAGIRIGQGNPVGEAHLAVQAAALALRERGVVLAVSSKNDDTVARGPFRHHPDMLLREDHIAVFQANWQDKASNLRAIAKTLNIGVDALVLLDDNPAERHQVRNELPEVGVPELPSAPDHYASLLLAAGYFETVQFTAEDRERAAQYQANASRAALLDSATDLQAHLASLQMRGWVGHFDEIGLARITQLINKTNQFNLTTRRRTEAEVAALQADSQAFTLQLRLADRFGDNGMICVVICLRQSDDWLIDTWLMSCRVLSRGVEDCVVNVLAAHARAQGVRRLLGTYLPTEKNGMVQGLYASLGFSAGGHKVPTLGSAWALDLDTHVPRPTHIALDGPLASTA